MLTDTGASPEGRIRALSPNARVYVVSAIFSGLALALHAGYFGRHDGLVGRFEVTWWHIAVLSLVAELLVVRLESRGETQSLSLGDIPVTIGLALANPIGLVVGRLAGAGIGLALVRRQAFHKVAFNLSLFALETVVAGCVYRVIAGSSPPTEPRAWIAAVAAVLTADALSVSGVTAMIALYAGAPRGASIRRALAVTWMTGLACAAIGLGVAASLWYNPPLAIFFVPVVGAVYFIDRTYLTLSQRYRSLEALHGFTRDVGRSLDIETVGASVLSSARNLMRAELAYLVLFSDEGADALVIADGGEGTSISLITAQQATEAYDRLVPGRAARLLDAPDDVPNWLSPDELREAAVAPVDATGSTVGLLLVMNARQDVNGFDRRDLTFFDTLANHASKAIENSRLFHSLQREANERTQQALHDPLTKLPNRHLLTERLEEALEAAAIADGRVAVLLLDLELFKEVNDTLGHHAGDNILRSVCHRLAGAIPPDAILTRFGGDEFVVLLPEAASSDEAVSQSERLLAAFGHPFIEQDVDIVIGASIGIALYPDHGDTAPMLLQRADVAMHHAKGARTGAAVYTPELDLFTLQRLSLAGQLRAAVDRGEIEVLYQPQVDLDTGLVTGAEALARWRHPQLGLLPPEDFIPAAEHTGAIKPLTLKVLDLALAACRSWNRAGLDLSVSVNLSVTSLLDQRLPDEVAAALTAHDVPASALVLELTEGSIMTDSRSTIAVLTALDEMGVRLSIDDFGTGYSSLSHLRRLPISEIKIDRSFVADVTVDEHDAVIVRTTIELGHQLGVRVVAEGAESADSIDALRELGCDAAQGFVISRPRSTASIANWLAGQNVARIEPPPTTRSLDAHRAHRDALG